MTGKKKIIFANQSTGSLMLDIVNAFVRSEQYEKIILFAGEINIRPTTPDEKVKIIKTIKYNKKNIFTRFLTWLVAFFHLLFVVIFKNRQYELFLVSNPPLNVFIPFFSNKQFNLLIYDIFPDTFIAQKVFTQNSCIVKKWVSANKKIFNRAKTVFTISNDMKTVLLKYVAEEKIVVVYNWCHPITRVERSENTFLKNYELQDKFVVLYSGNMGLTHDLHVIVDVAKLLEKEKDIEFVFIGEGGKKKVIIEKIANEKLHNCLVLPYQPNEMLSQTMGGADLGIITSDSGSDSLSIPSKTNRFLAMGIPLLCIANKQSELATIIDDNLVGKSFSMLDIEEMGSFILELKNNTILHKTLIDNALNLSTRFSPKNAELFVNNHD